MRAKTLIIVRAAAIGLISLLLIGLAVAAWLVVESLGQEPGDNMALMGLPLVAGLLSLPSMGLLAVALFSRNSLHKGEFVCYVIMSVGWLLPVAALVLLG